MNEKISYPQYRKYKNNKSYFKIISDEEFEEIQVLPKGNISYPFKAKILPDRNFILDLIYNYQEFATEITKSQYEEIKATAI